MHSAFAFAATGAPRGPDAPFSLDFAHTRFARQGGEEPSKRSATRVVCGALEPANPNVRVIKQARRGSVEKVPVRFAALLLSQLLVSVCGGASRVHRWGAARRSPRARRKIAYVGPMTGDYSAFASTMSAARDRVQNKPEIKVQGRVAQRVTRAPGAGRCVANKWRPTASGGHLGAHFLRLPEAAIPIY